jgi:vacuolar-type H+-ATPase subunit F/Vma7
MKLLVIGHEDAVLGFSLAGLEGFSTEDPAVALEILEDAAARRDVGLILITAGLANRLGKRLREMEQDPMAPTVLPIPAPGETLDPPLIRDLVRRALGVRL